MNLHGIVRSAIQAVNPDTIAQVWQQGIGFTQLADGTQVPVYSTTFNVPVQVQGLSNPDLRQANFLNLEGVLRKIYLYSATSGINRAALSGGDLLVFSDFQPVPVLDSNGIYLRDANGNIVMTYQNRYWKVVAVSERWPDVNANGWTAAIIQEQTDSTQFVINDGIIVLDANGTPVVSA